jgi:hypothetical protein
MQIQTATREFAYAAHEDISQKQALDCGNCISRMPKKEEEMVIRLPAASAVRSGRCWLRARCRCAALPVLC